MRKNNYDGVFGWLRYIIDYPYNKIDLELLEGEIKEKQEEKKRMNKRLNDEVINRKLIEQEKDNLIATLNKRIDVMGTDLSNTKKRNNELRNTIAILYKQNEDLEVKLNEKEKARRKNAGAIGGLKAKINELKQDLEKANHKVIWLKTNQKAPSKEEIIAYETRMKEVEKRQKEKK